MDYLTNVVTLFFAFELAVETKALFARVLTNFGITINYNPEDADPILTNFDGVEAIHCQLWETAFFKEF